jgi:hypothetical protein
MTIVTVEPVDGLHMYAGKDPSNHSPQSIPLQCRTCGVLNNPFDSQRGDVSPAAGEFVVPLVPWFASVLSGPWVELRPPTTRVFIHVQPAIVLV